MQKINFSVIQNLLLTVPVILLSACSTYPQMPETGTEEYRRLLTVVVQYCIPNDSSFERLGISEVRRWGYSDYQRSLGGGSGALYGKTYIGQNVFQQRTYRRPIDLLATSISWKANELEYVFLPPKGPPLTAYWTVWLPASSVALRSDRMPMQILREAPLKQMLPSPDAPKARYRLEPMHEEVRPRIATEPLPNC